MKRIYQESIDLLRRSESLALKYHPDDPDTTRTIRKAIPFEVDCIVPKEFSDLFHEEPTKM